MQLLIEKVNTLTENRPFYSELINRESLLSWKSTLASFAWVAK